MLFFMPLYIQCLEKVKFLNYFQKKQVFLRFYRIRLKKWFLSAHHEDLQCLICREKSGSEKALIVLLRTFRAYGDQPAEMRQ